MNKLLILYLVILPVFFYGQNDWSKIIYKDLSQAPKKTQILDLSDQSLTQLPEEIFTFSNLQRLDLSNNQLTKIPRQIEKLSSLKALDLSGNSISVLPKQIGKLVNLEKLDISYNHFVGIPSEIGGLIHLKKLYLNSNRLVQIAPEIGNLIHLKYFGTHNNLIQHVPSTIGNLKNLEELLLRYNNIKELPAEFANLNQLKYLDLSENPRLGSGIFKILHKIESLKILSVGGISVNKIPLEIGLFAQLESIHLDNNNLGELPPSFAKLTALRVVDLSLNPRLNLKQTFLVLAKLPNLKSLGLCESAITKLPQEIKYLKTLKTLSISENQLKQLPREIQKLIHLEELLVYDNLLTKEAELEIESLLPYCKIEFTSGLDEYGCEEEW